MGIFHIEYINKFTYTPQSDYSGSHLSRGSNFYILLLWFFLNYNFVPRIKAKLTVEEILVEQYLYKFYREELPRKLPWS